MLAWVIVAFSIALVSIACVTTIMIGAKRAPKEFPPYLLLLFFVSIPLVNWGAEWLPVPSAADTAVKLVGVALIYYFLYRSGPMQRDFYGKLLSRKG